MIPNHGQIGQSTDHKQAMGILFQSAITYFRKAEHALDDTENVFDFRPYFRAWSGSEPSQLHRQRRSDDSGGW